MDKTFAVETAGAAGFDGQMRLGTRRMAEIVRSMLGERHPLAERRSATAMVA